MLENVFFPVLWRTCLFQNRNKTQKKAHFKSHPDKTTIVSWHSGIRTGCFWVLWGWLFSVGRIHWIFPLFLIRNHIATWGRTTQSLKSVATLQSFRKQMGQNHPSEPNIKNICHLAVSLPDVRNRSWPPLRSWPFWIKSMMLSSERTEHQIIEETMEQDGKERTKKGVV